jgi:non-ribosomal peptide synthetase component E (peptide arylation enzyme)
VCAAVVGRLGATVDAAELRRFLEDQRIARQKVPEEFRILDDLPRTASGKVQKFRLVADWPIG